MLVNPNRRRRIVGRTLIVTGIAVALPLTASWATRYVDVPVAPTAPLAAAAVIADAIAPTQPTPPEPPRVPDLGNITNDTIQLHDRTMRWEQLSSKERNDVRAEVDKARSELERDRSHLDRDMAGARAEMAKFSNGDFQREMANARVEMANAIRELDANAADIRRAGQDPEALKAQVRASLSEIEHMDIAKITREAMESANPDKIKAELDQAKASLTAVTARLDQLDRQ